MPAFRRHNLEFAEFIRKYRVKRVAEIGVWRGTFCADVLRRSGCYLDQYWAIDNWAVKEGQEYGRQAKLSQEDWDELYMKTCARMTYFPMLHVVRGDSVDVTKIFPNGYFDMIYLDTSHFYGSTVLELAAWEPKVARFMAGHDYETPRVAHQGVKQAIDERYGVERVQVYSDGAWLVDLKGGMK